MKRALFLIGFCAFLLCAHAETIILRTGARVKGTVVFQNEEVVIIRDTEGGRFQYPRADVESVLTDDESQAEAEAVQTVADEEIKTPKKVSILLELAGGMTYMPGSPVGGAASVDLLVGSHHVGSRHLFIGGGLGYHGIFMANGKYNFLPIQVALRMPLTEEKHAPAFGVALGYGVALSKDYTGGIYAGLDFGYRYRINPRSAIGLLFFVQFQQATAGMTETIEGHEFINKSGCNFLTPGAKFAFYF